MNPLRLCVPRRVSVLLSLIATVMTPSTLPADPARALSVGPGLVSPLGYPDAAPTFSWKLPAGVSRQTAYRIEAKAGNRAWTWDSGWVESDRSTFVPCGGTPLVSRDQVTWRVTFRDEAGRDSGWSEAATFEVGLLSASDWKAKWIRPAAESDPNKEPVACLRRVFAVTKSIARARLHVTARGVFELELNGRRIGNDHFANGFTSYKKRIDTLTYDVTPLLRSGDNVLMGLLGSGWYGGRFPFAAKKAGPYGTDTALLAQLEIVFSDGSVETIASDEAWEGTFTGPIVSSSFYDGETYDARRKLSDWGRVVADANLGAAKLTPKPFAPVRETTTLRTRKITQPQPGRHVFDLGQNMVGWARIRIPVEKDQTISIRFAEMLQADGTLYTANYRSAKSTDTYTAAEKGTIEWEPHFTFHGFRYVELSGLAAGATPQPDWVTGVVLHSGLPTTGSFVSSHAKLNQLQSNIAWGWRGNSLDIPTDCPQRDERLGWTGDAQVFCATSLFNTDAHSFWKSWLRSMRDDQYKDGAIPPFVPDAMSRSETRSPGWMDAATIIPWDVYVRTGDTSLLAENYEMMERLVAWYRTQVATGQMPSIKGYGDWLQPYPAPRATKDRDSDDRHGDTPLPLLGNAFYARSATILANSARVLGRADEAKRYGDEAAAVRLAFATEYFDAAGKLRITPETQTAYVLAIAFDLIPEKLKPAAGENLARLVREAGGHLRTGFLGTPFIAQALDQTGHADVAAALLFQESYPSWFFPIDQGATTMWERWNSYTRAEGFGDVSMNSFNHYSYGAIGQWMYQRVAGLAPDENNPGYRHLIVRPLILEQLGSARAELETPYGKAASGWVKNGREVRIDVVVPPNTTATVLLPDGTPARNIAAGSHRFVVKSSP